MPSVNESGEHGLPGAAGFRIALVGNGTGTALQRRHALTAAGFAVPVIETGADAASMLNSTAPDALADPKD